MTQRYITQLALSKWSDQWWLIFNVDKCKVLHYGKHNTNHKYQMNNIAIYGSNGTHG